SPNDIHIKGTLNDDSGTLAGPGTLYLDGGTAASPNVLIHRVLLNGSLVNNGYTLMTHAGGYPGSGVTVRNTAHATSETQDNSGFAAQDGASGEQLVNAGTLLRTTTGYDAQNNVILVPFVNTGTVDAKSGSLYVSSPYLQSAGSTVLDGGNLAGQLDI